ncbi:HNH endonuclease [Radiobacillus kanasensis]|uniref:helix-turn-helix domain-containing protein n=1 Tax=Radiobacillus kanasensis TaxID=2844358 RepID=UPI001E5D4853|nr:helix-turn-helix domain-containing protein [Radiobacillus kanasensis]UFU00167.1 HNH endonuclease [Radiobacillus kanasensis]
MENLIDSKQLQEVLNISRTTLYRMEKEGLPVTLIGKSKRYNIDEVRVWIDNRQRGISNLIVGNAYHNDEITKIFKCANTGGMRRSHTTNTLVIFSDHTKGKYEDKWKIDSKGEEVLHFTGTGLEGDQDIEFQANKTLNESRTNGVKVYLFEAFKPGEHIFQGQVRLIDDPYQKTEGGRIVWKFPLRIVGNKHRVTEELLREKEVMKEKEAQNSSDKDLFNRAKNPESLGQRYTTSKTFDRDPYVSEYVKRRANGHCDLCGNPAPFVDKKERPYLESHHVKWLSKGGEDTIYNAVALDPSCHRKMHVLNLEKDVKKLFAKIEEYKSNKKNK